MLNGQFTELVQYLSSFVHKAFSLITNADAPTLSRFPAFSSTIIGLTLFRQKRGEADEEEPLEVRLCSVEQLEQIAQELAHSHRLDKDKRPMRPLLARLADNNDFLTEAYRSIAESVRQEQTISPAAEWLMDNFHIVQEQLREIKEDLPRRYYAELPKLADGQFAGYPRVYSIAVTLIVNSDSRLDADTLRRFVQSYQKVTPLTIGELWAVAIMLRVALVENLRRLARRILWARTERTRADAWADKLLEVGERQPSEIFLLLADLERNSEELSTPFAVQLLQRLRDQGAGVAPALMWLEQRFTSQHTVGDEIIRTEHGRQAANQVSVGNIITSMRLLSSVDWTEFVESTSLVERKLREDVTHARMDFETRNRYRTVIERIAKRTKHSELDIAARVIELAREASTQNPNDPRNLRRAHSGFYLIDKGRERLERDFKYFPDPVELIHRAVINSPTLVYFGTIFLFTAVMLWLLLNYAHAHGAHGFALLLTGLLIFLLTSDLGVSLTNRDITSAMPPRVLPKLNLKDGIPPECRTFTVIPAMLTSKENVAELLDHLEIHYLANQEENLYFALLTDFADAPEETLPPDAELTNFALQRIEELNARYGFENQPRFFLFHRRRLWNAGEARWMGWERKRGKLVEFNRLLRGATDTSYNVRSGDIAHLGKIKYVITLDADTRLPRDAARRLIGTLAHPLNHALYDERAGRVIEGYGILQPRVSITLESAGRSYFTRIFSGNTGVDPYTTAISDVYQDLFGEGSFVGKGIYDVDAFESALEDKVPENILLSHDLLEGLYARTALLTDVELFDDYPSHYHAYAMRLHRWVRGDWQIAGWLRSNLPLISRWKILDNLRRSLVAPVALLTLVAAWTILPGSPFVWTLYVVAILAFPIYGHIGNALLLHPRGITWTSHLLTIWNDAARNTVQFALTIAFLPHQSYLMIDAIIRTLWRVYVSKKKRLEWVTAAQAERKFKVTLENFWARTRTSICIALVILIIVTFGFTERLPVALVFLTVWLIAPVIAFLISRPFPQRRVILSVREQRELRQFARRTWEFFETFTDAEDHWLPPDNVQEDPKQVVAHRTSPTNLSLALLSKLSAHDFGYINKLNLVESLERTLDSMEQLERFRGHFYNWYDTQTLQPLRPQYISTVDSGNLAGHMLALKHGCLHTLNEPLITTRALHGLEDSLFLVREELAKLRAARGRFVRISFKHLEQRIADLRKLLTQNPKTLAAWLSLLDEIKNRAQDLTQVLQALQNNFAGDTQTSTKNLKSSDESDETPLISSAQKGAAQNVNSFAEAIFWAERIGRGAEQHQRYLNTVASWTTLISNAQFEIADFNLAERVPSLIELPQICEALSTQLDDAQTSVNLLQSARDELRAALQQSAQIAETLTHRFEQIAARAERIAGEMNFRFLFDEQRQLFAIGYSVADGRRDNSYYDLLASEARLTSFIAIALDQVPQQHWFKLGRTMTATQGGKALLSWTATMFEYLMPLLVMRTYEHTLLDETYKSIVARQIEYGVERSTPWGVSESAYNARDLALNYQYQAFGVPGLGLKRGLSDNLVVAPYATMLALMVRPNEAAQNLRRLELNGMTGRFGFYEALDFTPSRLRKNETNEIVKTYMAHHQGMSLVALNNCLHDNIMQTRFHAEPLVQATSLLLQERIPRQVPLTQPNAQEVSMGRNVRQVAPPVTRQFNTPMTQIPQVQLLSNGNYTVMVTNAGGGFSRLRELAVTRWREDTTRDNWGSFCYVRDTESGSFWSTAYQPTLAEPDSYLATFSTDKAEFARRDFGIETHTEITVSPEDDTEVRTVTVLNRSKRPRELELTSYSEIVIATPAADVAHPAFSNLFVESEFIAERNALIFTRRQRSANDKRYWAIHVAAPAGKIWGASEFETDRAKFIGRGRTPQNPLALTSKQTLSGSTGAVLDPVASLRRRVRLKPGERAKISFVTALVETREAAIAIADKYHDPRIVARTFALAWTHSQVELRHFNITTEEAHLFNRLVSRALYTDGLLRPPSEILAHNTKTQSGLWAYGISGDLPLVLVRVSDTEEADIVRQLLRAHEYWRMKGLAVDLVILNEHPASYAQGLQEYLLNLIQNSPSQAMIDKPGGIFLRRADLMSEEDRRLFLTVARVVLVGRRGTLAQQLERKPWSDKLPTQISRLQSETISTKVDEPIRNPQSAIRNPQFFNGFGGFTEDGREYIIVLDKDKQTPAPWSNVVANQRFGFIVTESGGGYTWSENSRENRLTVWSNDSICDRASEVIYLRDDETGEAWATTPHPNPVRENYVARHGQGYSVFEHQRHDIRSELTLFVPPDDSVKIFRLRIKNESDRPRKISVASYIEWVLGVTREASAPFVVTSIDDETGAIIARNSYNNEFASRVAFHTVNAPQFTFTANRAEFIGRNGTLELPAALTRVGLSGRVGAGLDPCAALHVTGDLASGEEKELIFLLGEGDDTEHARALINRYRNPNEANAALDAACNRWNEILEAVQVTTPDTALNVLLNRWLLYQTLVCRVWGRSGFYQSSGAYGFRDQLQDVMALVYSAPYIAREHILRAANRQFIEGDVQHWWHPPTGRGVRTRISDDTCWLVFVVCHYVNCTNDSGILDEQVSFLRERVLEPHEEEMYTQPMVSDQTATLYEHCARALKQRMATGAHGLPLMGTGDWNDGMNHVGREGKGESVWLAWFLCATLRKFAAIAEQRDDTEHAEEYRQHAKTVARAIEETAWDGAWYKRAFFDDGTPLGSEQNDECRIDAIAQSWAVISGAGDDARARQAMQAVSEKLVRLDDKLVLLFTPAFDKSALEPGYIKGYVPGVRENGGQYTHGALWTVLAFALLGDGDFALKLYDTINPINHALNIEDATQYKVEPYALAGDVYAAAQHKGRGGWTWYTGSASWMYRIGLEAILGFRLHGTYFTLEPCIPSDWKRYEVIFRHRTSIYQITVENPNGVNRGVESVEVNGNTQTDQRILLNDDGQTYSVRVVLGNAEANEKLGTELGSVDISDKLFECEQ